MRFFEKAQDKEYRDEHKIDSFRRLDKGHGRIECREAFITSEIQWMKEAVTGIIKVSTFDGEKGPAQNVI